MNRVVWRPMAIEDRSNIMEYIAADNINAADRWVGKPFDANRHH